MCRFIFSFLDLWSMLSGMSFVGFGRRKTGLRCFKNDSMRKLSPSALRRSMGVICRWVRHILGDTVLVNSHS